MFCIIVCATVCSLWILYWRVSQTWASSNMLNSARVALVCITWASTSIGMHVLNKSLATSLRAPGIITLAQMAMAVVVMGCTSFAELRQVNGRQLLIWMVVPVGFAALLITSVYTYEYISLSLLTVLRNLTPLFILPIESFVMPPERRPDINFQVVASILIMLLGAVVYGGSIEELSILGVALAVLNMLIAGFDRILQRRLLVTECQALPISVCTVANNFFGMFPTCLMAWSTGEFTAASEQDWTSPEVIILLMSSGLVGLGICYFGLEAQRMISATSFSVLQNSSKIVVVSVGVVIFNDPVKSLWSVLGIALSLGGSFLYAKAQMQTQPRNKGEATCLVEKKNEDWEAEKPKV